MRKYGPVYPCLVLTLSALAHVFEPATAGALQFEGVVAQPSCHVSADMLPVEARQLGLPLFLSECTPAVSLSLGTTQRPDRYVKANAIGSGTALSLPERKFSSEHMMLTLDYF